MVFLVDILALTLLFHHSDKAYSNCDDDDDDDNGFLCWHISLNPVIGSLR